MFLPQINNNNNKERGWEKTFGSDGYVYGIDLGDGFTDVYTYLKLKVVHTKYIQLFFDNPTQIKWVKKKKKEEEACKEAGKYETK